MAAQMSDQLFDALERQDTVSQCLAATVDLMVGDNIDDRGRGRVALLLDFIQKEYAAANEAVRAACRGASPPTTNPVQKAPPA